MQRAAKGKAAFGGELLDCFARVFAVVMLNNAAESHGNGEAGKDAICNLFIFQGCKNGACMLKQ